MTRAAGSTAYDAVIIGAGPNGLSAGIVLAARGLKTLILERNPTIGGGARTQELTEAGFLHDVCSAIHPLGVGSPFFQRLPLERYGLEWIQPDLPAAHPLDDGCAVALHRSLDRTAANLDSADREAYRRMVAPFVANAGALFDQLLRPLRPRPSALKALRFGLLGLQPASTVARRRFSGVRARALFAGMCGHSILGFDRVGTTAFGLSLMVAGHAYGWPFPKRGSQSLVDALAAYFEALGGDIQTSTEVRSFADLPRARAYLFDTNPRQMLSITGDRIGGFYRRTVENFQHGPGVFKVDYALSGPIPWLADECRRAGTVHLGGTFEDIEAAELAVMSNRYPARPFVLVAQQSLFDDTRAPDGQHTAWVYCHTPHGFTADITEVIEQQIERFAPGFSERIIKRHTMNALDFEAYNRNYVGGDISGGANHIGQIIARPALRWDPYSTPDQSIYLCSASTPPGGGVHGMSGYYGALSALRGLRSS